MTFAQIFGPICSLDALAVGSQSQSAVFGQSKLKDFAENCVMYDFCASVYDSIRSEDINHIWYFESILEHILLSFVVHLRAMRRMFLCKFMFGTT